MEWTMLTITSATMGCSDAMPTSDYHQPYPYHPSRPQARLAVDDRNLDRYVSHQRQRFRHLDSCAFAD
jgi:hypothetical protein